MKLTITEQHENLLLHRIEVEGKVEFDGATPSNKDICAEISSKIKKEAGLVVVKQIKNTFSLHEANFTAVAYNDAAAKKRTESMTKHLRKKEEEVRKKAAAEAQAKKEAEAAKKVEEPEAATSSE